jgi:hypothetical protein
VVTRHIAVINESENLSASDVAKAAAAIQRQVTDDFGPAWNVTGTADSFPSLNDMPHGYWPVVIRDEIGISAPGVHLSDGGEKAFALVLFTGSRWTVALSHEILEMLADPFGKTFLTGPSVRPDQGAVEYLVEVCDPCQSDDCGYPVNGVLVSDFVAPAFYSGFGPGRYTFGGNLTEPRTVCPFSYMTWRDPLSGKWWQLIDTGSGPKTKAITVDVRQAHVHLRGVIDRATNPEIARAREKQAGGRRVRQTADRKRVHSLMNKYARTTAADAAWWRGQIEQLARRTAGKPAGDGPGSGQASEA